jgi:hypothetical protein
LQGFVKVKVCGAAIHIAATQIDGSKFGVGLDSGF